MFSRFAQAAGDFSELSEFAFYSGIISKGLAQARFGISPEIEQYCLSRRS
ncbi:MAG: hypothetical protein JO097_18670 [Acidobacteriaceae bacterium]|nr:hypothetical protein [Acidobacteriaceae bacterium]MBV9296504.1 hypothetical protein [Acidobacteriaceae bacterium]MBV9766535.1 hypothetical protein [Acidobacteriaceae bacterium]